ncbi:DMT family transporter [Streptomyces yaanensis]|uniref:DMT family transporter n=1 Tax=Streptomyces yaanensis TaxID=1142239 RepID=A0ABV7SQX6_9ACTN|nr:DMT family transporter [Streptomyces sp. CGMCC 4.7035]WNC03004.1 DMT family transporter [Streptomyces sp. CGMCC 4.7035]
MVCALGAAVCFGTATVLQAIAARAAGGGGGGDAALLLRALRQWRYLAGLALDGLGFLLQIAALRSIPIYAVGAALASSLAVTAVVAARLLRVRLSRAEWGAVALVCAGLAMLGLASGTEGERPGSMELKYAMLGTAVAVLLLGALGSRLPERGRALALGLGAGFGFGVVEVAVRLIDDLGPGPLLTNPATYALLLGGGAAFLLLTSALQRGSVTTATAGMVIGETIGPAAVGVVWLGDRTREGLAWAAVLGFAVAVTGALALARFGEAPQQPPEAAPGRPGVTDDPGVSPGPSRRTGA